MAHQNAQVIQPRGDCPALTLQDGQAKIGGCNVIFNDINAVEYYFHSGDGTWFAAGLNTHGSLRVHVIGRSDVNHPRRPCYFSVLKDSEKKHLQWAQTGRELVEINDDELVVTPFDEKEGTKEVVYELPGIDRVEYYDKRPVCEGGALIVTKGGDTVTLVLQGDRFIPVMPVVRRDPGEYQTEEQ